MMTVRRPPPRDGHDTVGSITRVGHAPANPDDLRLALAGDRAAWERVVRTHSKLLWWVARSHRLDEATAADVVQTVWLQLVRFGDRITDPARLGAWLATTARRESLRRVNRRELPFDRVGDDADRLQSPGDDTVLDDELLGALHAAFATLSPEDQQLLRLTCDVPPRSYEEISALLGRPHGSIGPTRQRALNRLRAKLTEAGAL